MESSIAEEKKWKRNGVIYQVYIKFSLYISYENNITLQFFKIIFPLKGKEKIKI